ncbi:hypothetical protein ES702_07051 [subsurface metagenome]
MDKSDRDISQWDARLKQQLERNFYNYHNRRIDLSVARDNKQYNWTGETFIVEKASSANAIATVRLMFEDADELILQDNVEIKSIFNSVFISNEAQAGEWLDIIAGINFEYKKKIGIDEAGFFTSRCSVNLSADQAIPHATHRKVYFDTAKYDNDSEFDLVTNHRFIVKKAGVYHVSAQLFYLFINQGIMCQLRIRKNGGDIKHSISTHYAQNNEFVQCSGDLLLAVDDYLEVWAYQDNGNARYIASIFYRTYFDIHQIA